MQASRIFTCNYNTQAHITINQGGTSSGKTYAIMQVLFTLACAEEKQIITIVGQDIPNLKAGAVRDALNIYQASQPLKAMVKSFNKTDRVFELVNGSILEFKSYDNAQDAKSGKRDILFINEANGIKYDIYTELALRTRKRIYLDYNPNTAFWVHDLLIGKPGVQLIISDHRHNPFLDQLTRDKIERLKEQDEEQWRVYARGLTGKVTGLVLNNWLLCETIPLGAKRVAYGLDFGFTNDQTGLIEVYLQNGELWVNELLYETHLTNPDIAARMQKAGISKSAEIVADCAEPKSIEELRRLGWHIMPAQKGPDSVKNSIDILKRYKINVTRGSTNLRRELDRYQWKTDTAGHSLNEPVDSWNHLIDPLRYVALNKLQINSSKHIRSKLPWQNQVSYTDHLPL